MDSVFPFGFPIPTAGYLVLYVATFAVHQFFMHYVLAGTLYIAWCAVFPGRGTPRGQQPLAMLIRDWLPFLLSAAITAGVAPLLFVQIVYPRHFYTANLLLSWKWMIVVPLLIAAFYLLYLLKSRIISRWSLPARALVTLATAGCFVFVGFCWTTNHLLGNAEASWPDVYTTGALNLGVSQVASRMLVWIGGSFSSLAVFTAWQLRRDNKLSGEEVSRMTLIAMGGILVSFSAAIAYLVLVDTEARWILISVLGAPYLVLAVIGIVVQLVGWRKIRRSRNVDLVPLIISTAGLAFSLIGCSVAREVLRLHELDITSLYVRHAEASQIGGVGIFVLFAVVNTGLIGFCIWLVRSSARVGGQESS